MTLVTRTSLFFLAALAFVLLGLSAAIYGLMRYQLLGQVTAGTTNIAENLVAAVEIAPDGLEWEPGSRQFALQKLTGEAPVLWGVLDEDGKLLEGSITPELLSAVPDSQRGIGKSAVARPADRHGTVADRNRTHPSSKSELANDVECGTNNGRSRAATPSGADDCNCLATGTGLRNAAYDGPVAHCDLVCHLGAGGFGRSLAVCEGARTSGQDGSGRRHHFRGRFNAAIAAN